MSSRLIRNLAIGLAVILGGWIFLAWYDNDAREIGRQLKKLQKLVAKSPGEANLTSLSRAREVTSLFADPFEVVAEPFNFHTRDRQALAAGVHSYRSRAESIRMRIRERDLAVDKELRRATLHVTTDFVTDFRDLMGREAYRWQLNWVEQDGEWRIRLRATPRGHRRSILVMGLRGKDRLKPSA